MPRLTLVATAVLFSTSGLCIKSLDLSGWQVACFRSAVAACVLWLLIPEARRGWSWRTLAVGAIYAGTLTTFVLATKLTTAANAVFLQSSAPVYILFMAPWLLKERVRRADFVYMVIMLSGVSLFFINPEGARETAAEPFLGNLLALASGVFWAFTVMGLRWASGAHAGPTGSPLPAVVMGNVLAAVFCAAFAFPVERFGATDLALIVYLGVFQIGLAYFLLTRAIRRVPALEASLILNIEPAVNPLWVWIGQGERPSLAAFVGGSVIVGATVIKAWWDVRFRLPGGEHSAPPPPARTSVRVP